MIKYDMIGSGGRTIKKVHDREYLYFAYYDDSGKQYSKYCGRNGTDQAELIALKTEIESIKHLQIQTSKYLEQLKKKYIKLQKKQKE